MNQSTSGRAALPLVLLHGIGSNAASWAGLEPYFGDRRVVAWDAPGYGESLAHLHPHPTPDDYAAVLADFLDTEDVARCDLVGHSLGALIATRFARRWPGRVRHLVLSSPAAGYAHDASRPLPEKLQARIDDVRNLGPAGMAARRAANTLAEGVAPDVLARVRAAMAAVNVAGYSQATWLLAQGNLAADLAALTVPVSFIGGTADRVTPLDGVRALAGTHPIAVIEGAGHASYADHEAAYAAALRGLLG